MGAEYLKRHKAQGVVNGDDYGTPDVLFVIPGLARGPAQATFRNMSGGVWYISLASEQDGSLGLSATHYTLRLAAGESFTEENPIPGTVQALYSGSGSGELSYYASWGGGGVN